jgi:hypothetical protein
MVEPATPAGAPAPFLIDLNHNLRMYAWGREKSFEGQTRRSMNALTAFSADMVF